MANRWEKIYKKRIETGLDKIDEIVNKRTKESIGLTSLKEGPGVKISFTKGELLSDDYPVYGDYIYIVNEKPIRSDIFGTVWDLRRDLESQGKNADNIYSAIWHFDESASVSVEAWENL